LYTFKDKNNRIFTLTLERWEHIIERHPEMKEHLLNLGKVLRSPDIVCRSKSVYTTLLYYKKFKRLLLKKIDFSNVYIAVLVDISNNQIKTAYPTRKLAKGRKIWERMTTD